MWPISNRGLERADTNESAIIACCPCGMEDTRGTVRETTKMGMARTLTDRTFASVVMGEERPVLLEFWAPWCVACSQLDTVLERVVNEYRDHLIWARANEQDCPSLRKRLGIAFLPTLMVFWKGTEVDRIHGIGSVDELKSFVTRGLQSCAL